MELETGATFGPYRIDGTLGRGGMAVVYRAWEPNLERHVALKVLPAELLHERTFAERFHREARIAARLEHPHIVPIHAFGIEGDRPWMALRLLAGGSLADIVQLGRLEPTRAVAVLRDIADALDYAHQHKVIHRDVKPQNILLDERGRAYLADFGIGKMLESSSHITATGMIQGTPAYMAPEQAEGRELGPACDVYALGIVAYQCLAGRVPFSGTPVSVLVKQVSTPPPLPGPKEVAAPLTGALHRCLAKEPTDRWPNADRFVGALERGLKEEDTTPTLTDAGLVPVEAPPSGPVAPRAAGAGAGAAPARPRRSAPAIQVWAAVGAAVLIALGGLGLWWADRAAPPEPLPATVTEANETSLALRPTSSVPIREAAPSPPPAPVTAPKRAPSAARDTPEPARIAIPAGVPAAPTPEPPEPTPESTPALAPEPLAPTPTPTPTPTPEPAASSEPDAASGPAAEAPGPALPVTIAGGRLRVFCEARLEPRLFKKTKEKDVRDSARDLRGALRGHDRLVLAQNRSDADAVIVVLERGHKKMLGLPGTRKVRVRVTAAGQSIELVGQDKALGFNTWNGAAKGALKQAEEWLEATLEASPPR